MAKFNINTFLNSFNIAIKAIAESERITKDNLRWLSRDLLSQLHETEDNPRCGDIQFVNQLLLVLTPMNRKTLVLFMQEFSGFKYDDKTELFTVKAKSVYAERLAKANEFLDDPHNNLWTWAERNVKVEKKAFKLDTLTKDIGKALKAEDEEGNALYTKADVIGAILAGGITADDLMALLNKVE